MNPSEQIPCPLCALPATDLYHQDRQRVYHQCERCQLVFVLPAYLPSVRQERELYDLHENSLDDTGYRQFLNRLFVPLRSRLPPTAQGLDFGCGPGPALQAMFAECGYDVALYDPYYAPDNRVLARQYDFVCCTEVVEHFHRPAGEFERLAGLLNSQGVLGIMTKLVIDQAAFARWHYKNDPTHVCFYSRPTFFWLANRLGLQCEFLDRDVILLSRQGRKT